MPPKAPPPKLTKKQLAQLAKQQAKKKAAQQEQRKRLQQQRLTEEKRLMGIQYEKKKQQQRKRIQAQKSQNWSTISSKIDQQNKAYHNLMNNQEWDRFTTPYYKDFDTKQSKLSTFTSIFKDQVYSNPNKTLQMCEQSQVYVNNLQQKVLHYRSENDSQRQKQCQKSIKELRKIQMSKLQSIMIQLANQAEDIEEKNNEYNKTKGQPNRKTDGKIIQYSHYLTQNIKLGMFLNSTTTKNLNKFRPIQIKQFGLNTQIPSKWINANTIVKFQWTNFNPYPLKKDDTFNIIGGTYNLQFYQLLLGSKKVNNFTIKKFFKGKQILQKFKLHPNLIKQPFQIMYQIPKYVFLDAVDRNDIKIAQYDLGAQRWIILPNDTVVQYQVPQKRVVCRVSKPEPIAYVQQRCADYPYVAWQLRTIEQGVVHMDIQLKRYFPSKQGQLRKHIMVKFEITSNAVKLIMDKQYPQLKDLCNQVHTPQAMLNQLSKRGIHLLPIDDDYEICNLPKKDPASEKNAIRDISYAVQAFYIRNKPNSTNNIQVKMRQNLEYQSVFLEDQQKDWKLINWGDENACWVSNRNIQQRHLNFQILLEKHEFVLPKCLDRIKYNRDYLLRKTVMKMLSLTRVLSFISSQQIQSNLIKTLKKKIIVQ